jgi:hypothetical protein
LLSRPKAKSVSSASRLMLGSGEVPGVVAVFCSSCLLESAPACTAVERESGQVTRGKCARDPAHAKALKPVT